MDTSVTSNSSHLCNKDILNTNLWLFKVCNVLWTSRFTTGNLVIMRLIPRVQEGIFSFEGWWGIAVCLFVVCLEKGLHCVFLTGENFLRLPMGGMHPPSQLELCISKELPILLRWFCTSETTLKEQTCRPLATCDRWWRLQTANACPLSRVSVSTALPTSKNKDGSRSSSHARWLPPILRRSHHHESGTRRQALETSMPQTQLSRRCRFWLWFLHYQPQWGGTEDYKGIS